MTTTLHDLLPRDENVSNDELLGRFLEYVEGRRLTLYPAQESALLELFEEKNVILNTPTGSGKPLGAVAHGNHAWLTVKHTKSTVIPCRRNN